MDYNLKIGELSVPVAADIRDDGLLSAKVGNDAFTARYRMISENHLHLEVDGRGMNVYVADAPDGKMINIEGMSYLIRDADELARTSSRKKGAKEGPQAVTPPMPAVVVRIMVAEGDRVEKGQGVVVVTAMKMEATICAPHKGTVGKINVVLGDKVMPGQILVDIEKEEEGT